MFWSCPSCGGRAVGIGLLRKTIVKDPIDQVWHSARNGNGVPGRPCPSCLKRMVEVAASPNGLRLDVCRTCYVVWFDPKEYEQVPSLPQPPPEPELPEEVREARAIAQAQAIAEQMRGPSGNNPHEMWKYLPGILGMPVEYEQPALHDIPWATWTLTAFIVAFSVRAFFNLGQAVQDYGLVPAQAWRHGGFTFLTSFLLHGGVFHLLGNMYFLLVFGDNVEDYLGRWRYLALILAAAFVGDLAHIAFDPRPQVPVIGASGGISGVIIFYALKYPKAQIGILWRFFFYYFRWIRMPAYAFFAFWILMQAVGAWQQVSGHTNVSALGHLGGAAVGFTFWLVYRETVAAPLPPQISPASPPGKQKSEGPAT